MRSADSTMNRAEGQALLLWMRTTIDIQSNTIAYIVLLWSDQDAVNNAEKP